MEEKVIAVTDEKVTDAQRALKPIREKTRQAGIPWQRVLDRAGASNRAYYYWIEGHDMFVSSLARIQRAADELIANREECHE